MMTHNRRLTSEELAGLQCGHHDSEMRALERAMEEADDMTEKELAIAMGLLLLIIAPLVLWPEIHAALGDFGAGLFIGLAGGVAVMIALIAIGVCLGAGQIEDRT